MIYIYILLFYNFILAETPIAIVSKIQGKVKYKLDNKRKYHSISNTGSPLYAGTKIHTFKNSFSKAIFIDDGSYVSIYQNSELMLDGSVTDKSIVKKLKVINGTMYINSKFSDISFDIETKYSVLTCNNCSLWILSDKSNEKYFLEEGNAELYSPSINKKFKLSVDSTIILNKKNLFNIIANSSSDLQYLESLMVNANEKQFEIKNNYLEKNIEDQFNHTIVIKMKNAANNEKDIIIKYKQIDEKN